MCPIELNVQVYFGLYFSPLLTKQWQVRCPRAAVWPVSKTGNPLAAWISVSFSDLALDESVRMKRILFVITKPGVKEPVSRRIKDSSF